MATIIDILPEIKLVDLGDGTHALAVYAIKPVEGGTDKTFNDIIPALKATDNGDGTYSLRVQEVY